MKIIKRMLSAALVATVALGGAVSAKTDFPTKPIRIIIPYAPGGTTDIVGRQIGQRMSEMLGQAVIVENRSGANTAIGADAVARAPGDGYTLLFTNDATFVLNPLVFPALPYDVKKDFAPVASVVYAPLVVTVGGNVPANNMNELVAYIKASKTSLAYGSQGPGSQPHIIGEMFNKLAGIELIHVPYKGAGPAIIDVMGGQILTTFPALPSSQSHIASGRLKALAVSGDQRVKLIPDVPTLKEAGFGGMDIGAWYAFLAPAATPPEVVEVLNSTINKILSDPAFVEKNMTAQGMSPMINTTKGLSDYIDKESVRMKEIIARSGAKVD